MKVQSGEVRGRDKVKGVRRRDFRVGSRDRGLGAEEV